MGTIQNDLQRSFSILKAEPDRALWTHSRKVCIFKTSTGKLGIKVDTIQGVSDKLTFTIVTKIKAECCLGVGDTLHPLDRIICVNREDITGYSQANLGVLLGNLPSPVTELLVCSLASFTSKRNRDQLSNSSDPSYTDMRKGLETKRRPVESEPLLPGTDIQQPPCLESVTGLGCTGDENHAVSLPAVHVNNTVQAVNDYNNGRTCISLPNTTCTPLVVRPSSNTDNLLRFPHYIDWDPLTKTVVLTRGSRGSFGFKFKVKMSKNADDLFTLVECITPDGPADGKLMVGDWIRSVNGQPLQTPREASSIPDLLAKETVVRIVLQRPEGFSQNIFPISPTTPDSEPNPSVQQTNHVPQESHRLLHPRSTGSKSRSGNSDPPSRGHASYRVTPLQESDLISERDHEDIHCQIVDLNKTVNLPKVRVFLCGSEARALVRLLLPGLLPTTSDNNNGLYQCVRCTMGLDREGEISFTTWSSFDCLLNEGPSPSLLRASHESLTKSDIFRDRDEGSSFIHRGSINVEFFIMPDDKFVPEDKFFHHCCQYLFTRTSIFVLTFDGAKVVTSTHSEIQRLQNVIHTIRCFDGYECPILTYGLLSNDSSVGVDEVRTLFYLPFGQQIQKYNVPVPELFHPSLTGTDCRDVSRQLQRSIWTVLGEMTMKQKVSMPSVSVMHQLQLLRQDQGKLFIDETEFSVLFQEEVPGGGQDLQQIVWTDLKNVGEILSSKAAPLNLPHMHHLDKFLFIDPEVLLDCVQNVNVFLQQLKGVQTAEGTRQKGIRGLSTGLISEEDLHEIVSQHCPDKSEDKIIRLLEIFGLIFRQKLNCSDLGVHYMVPFVIVEQSTLTSPTNEPLELCLFIQFRTHTSSMVFYQLAFALNNESDTHNIAMLGPSSCSLSHLGFDLHLHHHKLRDRIQINLTKSDTCTEPNTVYQWLLQVCKATLGSEVKFVLGPACPQQDQCVFIGQHRSDMHVLDLTRQPLFCGSKLDNHRKVKIWLPNLVGKYVHELPYCLLKKISLLLVVETTFGNDWKGLGGLLGLTGDKVSQYNTQKEPCFQLLLDQGRSHRLTLGRLLELLEHPEMERKDIIKVIEDWLETGTLVIPS